MQRIAVIGCSGAGKSTMSRHLGEILGLEVIHLDLHYWRPGWIETPEEEWPAIHDRLVQGESWIMDGNFSSTMAVRLAAADTVIFLDFPRLLCLARVLRRWLTYYGRNRADLPPGCPEKFDLPFLKWIWNFPRRSRPRVLEALAALGPEKRVIVLRRPGEVELFLKSMIDQSHADRAGADEAPGRRR